MLNVKSTAAVDPCENGLAVTFVGDDDRRYDLVLSNVARRRFLDLLIHAATIGREVERPELMVTTHTVSVTPQSKALVVRTDEAGEFALSVSDKQIVAIRQSLAELLAIPSPQQSM